MEVASEALYHYRRLRFRARCLDSSAAHRVGVGYHGEWHFHSALGKRHRDCLVSDMRGIGLALDRVIVDLDTADLTELARAVEPPQLLDDVDHT